MAMAEGKPQILFRRYSVNFKRILFSTLFIFCSSAIYSAAVSVNILSKYHMISTVITAEEGHLRLQNRSFTLNRSRISIDVHNGNLRIRHEGIVYETAKAAISSKEPVSVFFGKGRMRRYPGEIIIFTKNGNLELVNKIEFETYIHCAVVCESKGLLDGTSQYSELIKAMEVCARSYISANRDRHYDTEWDFCDLTHCMRYEGLLDVGQALTTGEILCDNDGNPVECFFHSSCGGLLTKPCVFWEDHKGSTFREGNDSLNGISLCEKSPHYSWTAKTDYRKLADVFKLRGLNGIDAIYKSGRVSKIIFKTETANDTVDIQRFMSVCGRTFGWNFIKSNYFSIKAEKSFVLFSGKGLGHGVGLCQYGAANMIRNGANYRDVLNFYFPGAVLRK